MWTGILITIAFIGIMLLVATVRGLELRKLIDNGLPVKGRVIAKKRFTGKSRIATCRLRYEFIAQNGNRYNRGISLTSSEAAAYEIGDEIDIVYLPNKPKVSAAESMVALGREALQKKKS